MQVMLRGRQVVSVPVETVSSLMDQHHLTCVDLLKIDVERAELQVCVCVCVSPLRVWGAFVSCPHLFGARPNTRRKPMLSSPPLGPILSCMQVLQGVRPEHWPLVRQVVLEVHDSEGRLAHVVALLEAAGLRHLVVEQAPALRGSNLHQVWASREPCGAAT